MMTLKMANVIVGMTLVDNRDGRICTITGKNSKAKTVEIQYEGENPKNTAITTLNKHFSEIEETETLINPAEPIIESTEMSVETSVENTETATKKTKKACKRTKKTFEQLVADIPSPGNIAFVRNKKDEVLVKRGKKQIFRYTGRRIVCIREMLVAGLDYTKHSYGYVVAPTTENMIKIYANFS